MQPVAAKPVDKELAIPPGMDMSSAMNSAEEVLEGKHHFSVEEKIFTYERSQGKVPEKARARFSQALQQKYEHNSAKALQSLDEAIKVAPKYGPIYFEKAALLADLGKLDQAISVCDQMLTLDPKSISGLHLRACCYSESHRYQQAADDYSKAIALDKKDSVAYEERAKVYLKMGRQVEATHDNDEADRRNVRQKVALSMARGDSDKALKTVDDAIKKDPSNLELRTSKIFLCMTMGKQSDAAATCTSLMKDCPELLGALYFFRGKAYADMGKEDQALADYTQAMAALEHQAVPSGKNKNLIIGMTGKASKTVYLERASLYLKTKQYAKACADYSKYLATHKDAARVYLLRAEAYKQAGDMKKALADCKSAQAIDPTDEGINAETEEIISAQSGNAKKHAP